MSGHSKWSTIKRKKGAADQKRGKIFTRCIHEITIAVKEGGGPDPNGNPRLRFAIDKAKTNNMPNDTIDRAIKRASGELKGEDSFELTYEGYGPGGTAVMVEVLTNNKNRTVGEVRHAFSRAGGTLGENGCVGWMFDKKGLLCVKKEIISEDDLMNLVLDSGGEDVSDGEDVWEVICDPKDFGKVQTSLQQKIKLDSAEVQMIPKSRIELQGKEAEQMIKLIEALEDLEDVLNVYSNADFIEG